VEGSLWGFIAGVTVDLVSGGPFGAATLSLVIVGLLAGLAKTSTLRSNVALPALVVFLVTIAHNLIYLLVLQISGLNVIWLESLLRITLLSAALNAVLTPPIFGLMRWTYIRFHVEEMEL
jgi:rod shape-determining protein MreD